MRELLLGFHSLNFALKKRENSLSRLVSFCRTKNKKEKKAREREIFFPARARSILECKGAAEQATPRSPFFLLSLAR